MKCTSTGRACDGYAVKEVSANDTQAKTRTNTQVIRVQPPTISNELNVVLAGTYQERRGYHFFVSHTWPQLSVAINESSPGATLFCNSLLFQASHLDSAIRHAVVAAGSLDERLQINQVLTSDNEVANRRHEFACSQYCKAIGALREKLSSSVEPPTELTLMTCFIFVCFEFLQGNDAGALTHLKSGLEILQRSYSKDVKFKRWQPDSNCILPQTYAEDFRLYATELFTILDRTACTWLMRPFAGTVSPMPESPEYGSRVSQGFLNVDEADEYLNSVLSQMHCILPAGRLFEYPAPPPEASPAPIPLQNIFSTNLNDWSCAMEAFLMRSRHALSVEDRHRCTVLEISHTVGTLMLMASCAPNENDFYRASDASFTYIVSTSASLLRPVNLMLDHKVFQRAGELFSFHEGTIQPLYFTAVKSPNPTIRQNALDLLSTSPWREGAWDSAAMARIARRNIEGRAEEGGHEL